MSSFPHAMAGVRISLMTLALGFVVGCARGAISEAGGGPTVEELVSYYSPRSIKILPFTKPRSFDEDAVPDGIAVSLQPRDGAGDPVKAYGTFLFELYAYKAGTGSHRGERLQTWDKSISNPNDQKQFWQRVTATYEFQLSWEGQPIPPQKRYILVASFQAPGGERLFDEYEFEFRLPPGETLPAEQPKKKKL
jgi:hypothetical protein